MNRTETLAALSAHAVNDLTRAVMAHGITLSHDEADDLGEETLAWMGARGGLELNVRETDIGVECTPPVHYLGTDADGNLVTAEDVL